MIPFKPSSEKTLAHQLLTFVKLASVLKTEQKKLKRLKENRPKASSDSIKWDELNKALKHETEIANTEKRIAKLHNKTEEYEKELIQFVPSYLYNKTIEICLYGDGNTKRYVFSLKVVSSHEVVVAVLNS